MKIKLDKGAIMPTRAHEADAGLDLYAPEKVMIGGNNVFISGSLGVCTDGVSIKGCIIDTGVHIELPPNTVGMIKSKSGLNIHYGLITEGVIDEGYTGSIKVKIYNLTEYTHQFNRGDKIAQLVILPIVKPELELVDELKETERGNNGFGSTGR